MNGCNSLNKGVIRALLARAWPLFKGTPTKPPGFLVAKTVEKRGPERGPTWHHGSTEKRGDFKDRLITAYSAVTPQQIRLACRGMKRRIVQVIAANGHHIKRD